jgi:hypothetical protein
MEPLPDEASAFARGRLLARAFVTGERWLAWLRDAAVQGLGLTETDCARALLDLRARGSTIVQIANTTGLSAPTVRRRFASITHAAANTRCPTIIAAAVRHLALTRRRSIRVVVFEANPARDAVWRDAARCVGVVADSVQTQRDLVTTCAHSHDPIVAVVSPFVPCLDVLPRIDEIENIALVFSSTDPAAIALSSRHRGALFANPDHDFLPAVLAHAIANVDARATTPTWSSSADALRTGFVDALSVHGGLSGCSRALVDAWIDADSLDALADRLCISRDGVESRVSTVTRSLGIPRLTALPLGAAYAIARANQPSPAQPGPAEGAWFAGIEHANPA